MTTAKLFYRTICPIPLAQIAGHAGRAHSMASLNFRNDYEAVFCESENAQRFQPADLLLQCRTKQGKTPMKHSKQSLLALGMLGLSSFGCAASAPSLDLKQRTAGVIEDTKILAPSGGSQTIIWGAGAPVGNNHGQFANAFVQAISYSPGNNTSSWTAVSIFDSDGGVNPGQAFWTRSLTGRSQGGYVGSLPVVSSPSQANGVAIFDSDFLDNAGVQGAFGLGTSPSPHRGELISPQIDLSGYSNVPLAIRLYSYYRDFDIDQLSVSFSTNDGGTWSPPVDYRANIADLTEGFVTLNFPNVTDGVANLTQCRVKIIFEGDYYFAIVDDLSVRTALAYDLALGVPNANGTTLPEQGDVIHLTGNRYFPNSQLVDKQFDFDAAIRNLGSSDLLPAQNPALGLVIEKNVDGNWASVYTDSIAITETIPAGGYVAVDDNITDSTWVEVGDFRATYTASFSGTEDLTNNVLTHFFTITPDTYASKVDREINGDPSATQASFPTGGSFTKIEFGSVFYFDAANTSLSVNSISVKYRLRSDFAGATSQDLFAYIYSVNPSTGLLDDRTLLMPLGMCVLPLTGLGTVVPLGGYGSSSCAPLDTTTGAALGALPTGHYYVSVAIEPEAAFTVTDVPSFGVSTSKNYNLNVALTLPGSMVNVSALSITPQGMAEQWFSNGFGATFVPSIGVGFTVEDQLFRNGFETAPAIR